MPGVLIVLYLLIAVVVLFVAAAVATREVDGLAESPPDRADVGWPDGPLEVEDVAELRFGMVLRGYRMSEVDEALARLAGALGTRDHRIAELEQALAGAVASTREPVVEPTLEPAVAPTAEPALDPAVVSTGGPVEARVVHPSAVAPAPVTERAPESPTATEVRDAAPAADLPPAVFSAAPPVAVPNPVGTPLTGPATTMFGAPPAPEPADLPPGPPAQAGPAQDPDDDLFPEVLSADPADLSLPDAGDSWDLPPVRTPDEAPASDVPHGDPAGQEPPAP